MVMESRKANQTWHILEEALSKIKYKREEPPIDRFKLHREDDANYAVLYIYTYNPNTYHPEKMRCTGHEFVVPAATYNEPAWVRWVFNCIASIELHETCENFFVDGVRVYAPHHGNGWNPYDFWPGYNANEKLKAPGED